MSTSACTLSSTAFEVAVAAAAAAVVVYLIFEGVVEGVPNPLVSVRVPVRGV